nr:Os01g0890250 [Ipomoea batatas]
MLANRLHLIQKPFVSKTLWVFKSEKSMAFFKEPFTGSSTEIERPLMEQLSALFDDSVALFGGEEWVEKAGRFGCGRAAAPLLSIDTMFNIVVTNLVKLLESQKRRVSGSVLVHFCVQVLHSANLHAISSMCYHCRQKLNRSKYFGILICTSFYSDQDEFLNYQAISHLKSLENHPFRCENFSPIVVGPLGDINCLSSPEESITSLDNMFHFRNNCCSSATTENSPGLGSSPFLQQVSFCRDLPVNLLYPSFAPGSHVSVGSSKLCQIIFPGFDLSLSTKFPVLRRTASSKTPASIASFSDDHITS